MNTAGGYEAMWMWVHPDELARYIEDGWEVASQPVEWRIKMDVVFEGNGLVLVRYLRHEHSDSCV